MSAYISRVRPHDFTFRPASAPQLSFIARLIGEKDITEDEIFVINHDIEQGLSSTGASQWIDFLKARRRKPAQGTLVDVEARERISEPGYYLKGDQVFKVVRTRDGERLYAKLTTAHGLDYVEGAMRGLFADMKMTGEQMAEYGARNSYCVVCSSEFDDPTSKHIGIGPKCGPDNLGSEAYKALRLSVADRPDVIAYEAKKRADAKARRDAKKAEEAQLSLAV